MLKQYQDLSIVELWAEFLLGLQFLSEDFDKTSESWPAAELSELQELLSELREGGPFGDRADERMARCRDALEESIERQTLGLHRIFDGVHDPDLGDVGRVIEERILTPLGEAMRAHLEEFRKLAAMRGLLAARIDADRQLGALAAS